MYSGTLINDLFAMVEAAEQCGTPPRTHSAPAQAD